MNNRMKHVSPLATHPDAMRLEGERRLKPNLEEGCHAEQKELSDG